jgi:hypothetical protein
LKKGGKPKCLEEDLEEVGEVLGEEVGEEVILTPTAATSHGSQEDGGGEVAITEHPIVLLVPMGTTIGHLMVVATEHLHPTLPMEHLTTDIKR